MNQCVIENILFQNKTIRWTSAYTKQVLLYIWTKSKVGYFDINYIISYIHFSLHHNCRSKRYFFFCIAANFAGAKYLVQGKRLSNEDWLYADGSMVNDLFTHWDDLANPTEKNKKNEYIVLQPHSGYTWLNSAESEPVSGYVCEGWNVYIRFSQW